MTTESASAPAPSVLMHTTRTWGEMIKFSHSVFALPYAVLAAFLAARPGLPDPRAFGLIVLCMVAARSAAMTFNRIVDAAIDARNPRTARRPIPAGHISIRAAWSFFVGAVLAFALGCAGFLLLSNPWPILLAVPVLAVLCGYSYTKRFTRWSHVVLGLSIAMAPPAAWLAINPDTLGWPSLWLVVAVASWIGGFDVIYACQDAEFDRAAGLFSLPARIGVPAALWTARGLHAVTVTALLALAPAAELGTIYLVGVACVAVLLIVENALVSPGDLRRVNLAFFTVNGVVSLLLGAMGVADVCVQVLRS